MPQIEELDPDDPLANQPTNASTTTPSPQSAARSGTQGVPTSTPSLADYIRVNHIDLLQGVLHLLVVLFSVLHLLTFGSGGSWFQKALLAYGAASALRLHQRVGGFSRDALQNIMNEDAFHHLFFVLMFVMMSSATVTFILFPAAVMSFAKSLAFIGRVANDRGIANAGVIRKINDLKERETPTLLLMAAGFEALIFPLTIILIVSGRAMLFLPFMYFQYLKIRYRSRRNPYTRLFFTQARFGLEHYVAPRLPAVLAAMIFRATALISRFAPAIPPAA